MTFEEWLEENQDRLYVLGTIEIVRQSWQAAQEAERRRIYQILDRVAIDANHSQWDACCFTVKDRITGVRNG